MLLGNITIVQTGTGRESRMADLRKRMVSVGVQIFLSTTVQCYSTVMSRKKTIVNVGNYIAFEDEEKKVSKVILHSYVYPCNCMPLTPLTFH